MTITISNKFFLDHIKEFKSPLMFFFYLLITNKTEFNLYETGRQIGLSSKTTYLAYKKIKKMGLVTELRKTQTDVVIRFNKNRLTGGENV